MKIDIKNLLPVLLLCALVSCKKMLEVPPPKTQLTVSKAFANDNSAVAVLSNIYAQFNSAIDNNLTPAISSYVDELSTTASNQSQLEFYNGAVSSLNTFNLNIWKGLYSVIYQSNALLENIDASVNLTQQTRQQLRGEALFLRSLSYFYLVNLYGDVPLLLATDVSITSNSPRTKVPEIYSKITSDLLEAETILKDAYPSPDRVRANRWAATALLSRIYLYQKDWSSAEVKSTAVISSGIYSLTASPGAVFTKNSNETILQFWTQSGFTNEGSLFVPALGSVPTYPITQNFLSSFQTGDLRKAVWTTAVTVGSQAYYYPSKYKNRASSSTPEYLVTLRLTEQHLIRSEARARQNKITEALADLNLIRRRAGLSDFSGNTQAEVLAATEQERRTELFAEWGHRFFDLKRYDRLTTVMQPLKPAWLPTSALLPIPQSELLNNPGLTQNPGY
jgi:starch-binding outer membrane protein, SusD/RagB family